MASVFEYASNLLTKNMAIGILVAWCAAILTGCSDGAFPESVDQVASQGTEKARNENQSRGKGGGKSNRSKPTETSPSSGSDPTTDEGGESTETNEENTTPDEEASGPIEEPIDEEPAGPGQENTSQTGQELFGPGLGNFLLHNTHLTSVRTDEFRSYDAFAIGFVAKGTRINAIRLFHVYRDSDSGYNRGDGGILRYEIHSNSEIGSPGTSPLASTPDIIAAPGLWSDKAAALQKYPGAVWSNYGEGGTKLKHFRLINLDEPLSTVPGRKYWIVVKNISPDQSNSISINAMRNRRMLIKEQHDASFEAFDWTIKSQLSGQWTNRSSGDQGLFGIFEINGDTNYGQAYYQMPAYGDVPGDSDRVHNINGERMVRQEWLPDRPATLTKFVVAGGRNYGSSPITLRIVQNGVQIFIGAFNGLPQLSQPSTNQAKIGDESGLATIALPDVRIAANAMVHFELSTLADTDYEILAGKDGGENYFSAGGFPAGRMEVNVGNGWQKTGNIDIGLGVVGVTQ